MGLHDRDYYRRALADKERESFFSRALSGSGSSPSWLGAIGQSIVYCLAIYGAISLLSRYI